MRGLSARRSPAGAKWPRLLGARLSPFSKVPMVAELVYVGCMGLQIFLVLLLIWL